MAVTLQISDTRPGEAEIRPIALWPHGPLSPTMELLMRAFTAQVVAQVVEPLREWLARHREP